MSWIIKGLKDYILELTNFIIQLVYNERILEIFKRSIIAIADQMFSPAWVYYFFVIGKSS